MYDFEARKIVEALRSGISSHEVGRYFSSARQSILNEFEAALSNVVDDGTSGSKIFSGKYGEGKTHLLNTISNMALTDNMVVSLVTLSKETPLSNMNHVYARILQNTFLPGYAQPGIAPALSRLSLNSPQTSAMLEYCLTHLELNRLYYVLKSYIGTQDDDEKYLLGADFEGDFIASGNLRKIYKRIYGEAAVFNGNFVKSKHIPDYIAFVAHLFRELGYGGWVILFDEAELIGRLGRKSRHKAYLNMHSFLHNEGNDGIYSVFAFNSSFTPDVIEAKHEFESIDKNDTLTQQMQDKIVGVLTEISEASQLAPLSRAETSDVLGKILEYHGSAYGWQPQIEPAEFMRATDPYGYLLRTRIRSAVEMLDQLFQYGEIGEIRVTELGQITFEEDSESSLESLV